MTEVADDTDPSRSTRRHSLGLMAGVAAAFGISSFGRTSSAMAATTGSDGTFESTGPDDLPLSVRGASGQVAPLTVWRNADGEGSTQVEFGGRISQRPKVAVRAPFVWEVGATDFSGITDPVSYFGYNVKEGGEQIVSDEPLGAYVLEADYFDGAKRVMELYAEFRNRTGEWNIRPFFFQFNRDAATPAEALRVASVTGSPFVVEDPERTQMLMVTQNQLRVPVARAALDSVIDVQAAPSRAALLRLGANGVDGVFVLKTDGRNPRIAHIEFAGRRVAQFSGAPIGADGAGMSVGTSENTAVGTFSVGDSHRNTKGLVVRGRDGQVGNLQEWQQPDGTVTLSVTPDGALRWGASQEAPVDGPSPRKAVKYLRVIDSTGTPLFIPAYAA